MKKLILMITVIMAITLIFPLANADSIPDWIKNTAGWWATDKISETEFVNAIEFLVNVGIIQTESDNNCVEDISKFFKNKQKIIDACEEYRTNIIELVPYKNNVEYNNKGFRGENFSNEKVSNVYRIFMVGGSTMIGSTSNDTTIPSILQRMFDSSELEFEVEVINSGFSGGNTISELALIKSELVSYNPNLIIMYDGWNDLSADYPVIGTIDKWQRVCSIAYENKFDVIIALQPIAGFGNKILTQQEKINSLTGEDHNGFQLLQAKSTYEYFARELQNLDHNTKLRLGEGVCETYDLRNTFDNVKGSIYWDQGHTLEAGNLIIAEKFFNISMKKLDSKFKNDFKFTELISKYNSKSIINFLLDELNVQEKSLDYDIKDKSKIDFKKGKYFLLKSEHQNVSNILVGSDLRDVDLSELDLNNQDLTGANLSGQDLRDVDLSSTIIRGANFSNTNLEGKNLSGMDIRGINFSNANMKNVDLRDVIISKPIQLAGYCTDRDPFLDKIKNSDCSKIVADNEEIRTKFNNANLQNTKFGNTNFEITQSLYFIDFSNSDLTNSDISNAQFIGSEFNNAILDNVTLNGIFAIQTNFINVQMENFNILNSWFQSVSFNEANMTNGNLDGSTLVDVEFIDTDLYNTTIGENLSVGNNNFNCKNNDMCDK